MGAGECLFACCCPCIYAVTVSQEAGQDQWGFLTLASALFLSTYLPFFVVRSSVRDQFNIGGSTLEDVCASCCCRKYFFYFFNYKNKIIYIKFKKKIKKKACCAMLQVKGELVD